MTGQKMLRDIYGSPRPSRLGHLVFLAAWPFWRLYFALNPRRTRVAIVCDGRILLVRGRLGDGSWSLPGGGTHRHESLSEGAVREVCEETGIQLDPGQLLPLGSSRHSSYKLPYVAHYFTVEIPRQPELVLRQREIIAACWQPVAEAATGKLDQNARFAVLAIRSSKLS